MSSPNLLNCFNLQVKRHRRCYSLKANDDVYSAVLTLENLGFDTLPLKGEFDPRIDRDYD